MKITAKDPYLPIYTAEGSGFNLGYTIGRQGKEKIHATLSSQNRWFFDRKQLDKKKSSRLDKLLEQSRTYFPQYVAEIEGYAKGAEIDFRDLWIMNCADSVLIESCSDVYLINKNNLILGHNEDFNNATSDHSYFLHLKLATGCEIFTHAYPGLLPGYSFGMNSHGIAFTCNTVPNYIENVGVPRPILDRWLLESESVDEFLHRVDFRPRSGVFSYNIISLQEHKAMNVETTQEKIHTTEVTDKFFHTNHYLCPAWKDTPVSPISTSYKRYKRLTEIIPAADFSEDAALDLLHDPGVFSKDHAIFPGWYGKSFATAIFQFSRNRGMLTVWPYSKDKSKIMKVEL